MNKENNIFENAIRESLNNHEAPYDASAWKSLSAKLPSATPFYKTNWFRGGAAILIVAVIATVSLWDSNPEVKENSDLAENSVVNNKEANLLLDTPKSIESDYSNLPEKVVTKDESDMFPNVNDSKDNENNVKSNENLKNPKSEVKRKGQEDVIQLDEDPNQEPGIIGLPLKDKKSQARVKNVEETLVADFTLAKEICQKEALVIVAKPNRLGKLIYSWKINGNELTGNIVKLKMEKEGMNTISLFVKDKSGEILAKKSKEIFVNKLPENNIKITSDENSLVNKYEFELLNNESTIVWDFGDNTKNHENKATHTYKGNSFNKCFYTITSKDGCTATYEKDVKVLNYYNMNRTCGFSPNNDGLNDYFIPTELARINQPFEMTIQSRNGAFIYKTNSINSPWDGNLSDGSKAPFGAYIWKITLTNELGNEEKYLGTVVIVNN